MTAGNRLGLVLVAAAVVGSAPSFVSAAEHVVLGEYFTNQY